MSATALARSDADPNEIPIAPTAEVWHAMSPAQQAWLDRAAARAALEARLTELLAARSDG